MLSLQRAFVLVPACTAIWRANTQVCSKGSSAQQSVRSGGSRKSGKSVKSGKSGRSSTKSKRSSNKSSIHRAESSIDGSGVDGKDSSDTVMKPSHYTCYKIKMLLAFDCLH